MELFLAGVGAFFLAPIVYWGFIVTLFAILILAEEKEFIGSGTFVSFLIIWLASLPYGGLSAIFAAIKTAPIWLAIGFIGFIGLGVVWAFFKWSLYMGDAVKIFENFKAEYMEVSKIESEADILLPPFLAWLNNKSYYYRVTVKNLEDVIPSATMNKKKITAWIMFWPASAAWFILNDPIRRAAEWVFEQVKGVFEAIAKRTFGKAFVGIGKI